MPEPTGIAYDPTTGDLVVGSVNGNGNGIYRISRPLTAAPSVQRIAEGHGVDGVAVGPDGTIYAAKYQEGIWIVGGEEQGSVSPYLP